MFDEIDKREGFIAALDQSGGGSKRALSLYGINDYKDEDLFDLMHDMRERVIKSKSFTKDKILGVILFEEEVERKIDGKDFTNYLLDKGMIPFVKIDRGLLEKENGVELMKDIPDLEFTLDKLKRYSVFGTKMRSVIYENNREGIRRIVKQQFDLAKVIWKSGLVPILEPEVDIHALDKEECEKTLKEEILRELDLSYDMKVILKLSLPSIDNFYIDLINNDKVLKVLALSGGYSLDEASRKLSKNKGMIASFSRALLERLRVSQNEEEFDNILGESINKIYLASVK